MAEQEAGRGDPRVGPPIILDERDLERIETAVEERYGNGLGELYASVIRRMVRDFAPPPVEEGERGEGWWDCPHCQLVSNPSHLRYCSQCMKKRPEARQGEGDEGPRCEKCGTDDVSTRYEEEKRFRRMHRCQETKEEHLHRTCRNCGYDWCDPVLTGLRAPQGEGDEDYWSCPVCGGRFPQAMVDRAAADAGIPCPLCKRQVKVAERIEIETLLRDYFEALDEYRNITRPGRAGSGFAEASKRVTSAEDRLRETLSGLRSTPQGEGERGDG